MPVIRHFEDTGLLYRVNADQPIEDVFADIKKLIETVELD
jgi:adenylate kinase family enzyme